MTGTVRVVLNGDYDHGVHGEPRVFRKGFHTMPIAMARLAHAKGLIDGPAPTVEVEAPAAPKVKRVRKPKAKVAPKPAPAAKAAAPKAAPKAPAKKPAAKAAPASGSGAPARRPSGKA